MKTSFRRMADFSRLIPMLAVLCAPIAGAAEMELKVVEKEPPAEFDASIREVLQPRAIQLLEDGKPMLEFWFRSELPVESKPDPSAPVLRALKEATLIGAAVVHQDRRDYRDNELFADKYTMRFALQPQDGDHLGTAAYPFFLVLVPAKQDKSPDGIKTYKALVRASGRDTPSGHPVVLSLRPLSSEGGEFPKLAEPAPEHKSVQVKIPATVTGSGEKFEIAFDLVYEGKGKI